MKKKDSAAGKIEGGGREARTGRRAFTGGNNWRLC